MTKHIDSSMQYMHTICHVSSTDTKFELNNSRSWRIVFLLNNFYSPNRLRNREIKMRKRSNSFVSHNDMEFQDNANYTQRMSIPLAPLYLSPPPPID